MGKLVSIVLPVYNGEKFLRESIESVINQTYKNWELLILDDCSTDSTPEISKEYCNEDSRIKYYRNETNLKLPNNLNKGFSLSEGDYFTWTSDDNRYHPTAIEKMVDALENSDSEFVFASCRIINEYGEEIEYIMVDKLSPKRIVGVDSVGACFLYSRAVYKEIGDYDDNFRLVEDFDYWQRICSRFKVTTISEILYYYRYHSGALTSTKNDVVFNDVLEKMLLKNRCLFGHFGIYEKYYYYLGLSRCRNNNQNNPYIKKCRFYSFLYFIFYRVPNKAFRFFKLNI